MTSHPVPKYPIKLEKFLIPFLRMITNNKATIRFKLGEDELYIKAIDYDLVENRWTVNLTRYQNGSVGK